MRALIYFFYSDTEYCARECDGDMVEKEVGYWLRKSPGSYPREPVQIVAVNIDQIADITYMIDRLKSIEHDREQKRQEAFEKSEYERLKAKFG